MIDGIYIIASINIPKCNKDMITQQHLIDRFGRSELAELSDREHGNDIIETVVQTAIDDAEAEVEGYLKAAGLVSRNNRGRLIYLDDQAPPKALTLKLCDIARYYLYADGVTDIVETRYNQAISWLKLVMTSPEMLTGERQRHGHSGVYVIANRVPDSWQM